MKRWKNAGVSAGHNKCLCEVVLAVVSLCLRCGCALVSLCWILLVVLIQLNLFDGAVGAVTHSAIHGCAVTRSILGVQA